MRLLTVAFAVIILSLQSALVAPVLQKHWPPQFDNSPCKINCDWKNFREWLGDKCPLRSYIELGIQDTHICGGGCERSEDGATTNVGVNGEDPNNGCIEVFLSRATFIGGSGEFTTALRATVSALVSALATKAEPIPAMGSV